MNKKWFDDSSLFKIIYLQHTGKPASVLNGSTRFIVLQSSLSDYQSIQLYNKQEFKERIEHTGDSVEFELPCIHQHSTVVFGYFLIPSHCCSYCFLLYMLEKYFLLKK